MYHTFLHQGYGHGLAMEVSYYCWLCFAWDKGFFVLKRTIRNDLELRR